MRKRSIVSSDADVKKVLAKQAGNSGSLSHNYLSFFSGALGLDVGLENAGLKCLAANELDPWACKTIRLNRPELKLYEGDIRGLTADRLRKDLPEEIEDLFAIVGGPPCQAFSTAGKRNGLNDERGNVFLHFVRLVCELRPKYAVFENVRGLLSAPLNHRPHNLRGGAFDPLSQDELPGGALHLILGMLEEAGYKTTFTLYNTANFGVPQKRERLVFFASREGRAVPHMAPTHSERGENGMPPWVSVRKAFKKLSAGDPHYVQFPAKRLKYFSLLTEGQNWRDLPICLQAEAMGASFLCSGGRTGFYRRLAWDKPSPTLVTRPTMKATDLCHPDKLRPLSIEEYSTIQTFPNEFKFAGSLEEQYRQVGNAVPCAFAQQVGNHLMSFDRGTLIVDSEAIRLSRYLCTDQRTWRNPQNSGDGSLYLFEAGYHQETAIAR